MSLCACCDALAFSNTGSAYPPGVNGGGCSSSLGSPYIGDAVRRLSSGVEYLLVFPPDPIPRLLPPTPESSAGWFLNSEDGATRLRIRHLR